jgi:hypothetical protein
VFCCNDRLITCIHASLCTQQAMAEEVITLLFNASIKPHQPVHQALLAGHTPPAGMTPGAASSSSSAAAGPAAAAAAVQQKIKASGSCAL